MSSSMGAQPTPIDIPTRSDGASRESFDAVLFLSFGGPDGPDDVMPFLENVTRGRGVPRERLTEVAEHYYHFDGVSPINRLNLDMIAALRAELDSRATKTGAAAALPIYFGNRNWTPLVEDTLEQAYADGHRRLLVFATSAWGGYSGCRQYHEDIARAVTELRERRPEAEVVLRKLPQFYTEPGFRTPNADAVQRARQALPASSASPRLVFTAHSIPVSADEGGLYSRQVAQASAAVAAEAGFTDFDQVWQSRSGPPQVPWLEPDICDHLESLGAQGVQQVIVAPIGFISDHLEVVWDLDNEALETTQRLGMDMVRADTAGTDPRFIAMIADLIERYADGLGGLSEGGVGDNGDPCSATCCPVPRRPVRR